MIDYDSFSRCHLTTFFSLFTQGAKELNIAFEKVILGAHWQETWFCYKPA